MCEWWSVDEKAEFVVAEAGEKLTVAGEEESTSPSSFKRSEPPILYAEYSEMSDWSNR